MQLSGTLDIFPLRELIEMVTYSSVTGVLEVQASGEVGQLFFKDGRPYHAIAGMQLGVDAVGTLFQAHAAPFRFLADHTAETVTLWLDPWDLMDRGEELARQWLHIRQRIPHAGLVPVLAGTPARSQIHIGETTWPVLSAIDGQRTIEEIAVYLNLLLLDTCLALATLIDQELVTLTTARQQALHPSAQPAGTPETQAGFLERMLADAQAKAQQRPDLTDEPTQERKQVYRYVDDRR